MNEVQLRVPEVQLGVAEVELRVAEVQLYAAEVQLYASKVQSGIHHPPFDIFSVSSVISVVYLGQ